MKKAATGGQYGGKAMSALWPKGPRQWVWFVVACAHLTLNALAIRWVVSAGY